MDWQRPPAWLILAVTWGIPLVAFGLFVLVMWLRRERPRCVVYGLRVYADDGLEVLELEDQVRQLLNAFEDWMIPECFMRVGYRNHLAKMRCDLREDMLRSSNTVGALRARAEGLQVPLYTGLTHSPTEIEVSCAEALRVSGQVRLSRTAFLYELMNAMIWALDEGGVYVAYAEGFLDPKDPAHWRWLADLDGDEDVDEADVFAWKARRKRYDDQFAVMQAHVRL